MHDYMCNSCLRVVLWDCDDKKTSKLKDKVVYKCNKCPNGTLTIEAEGLTKKVFCRDCGTQRYARYTGGGNQASYFECTICKKNMRVTNSTKSRRGRRY